MINLKNAGKLDKRSIETQGKYKAEKMVNLILQILLIIYM